MTSIWLADVAELGRRAVAGDLTAVTDGLGQVTLRRADDIHVVPDRDDLEAIAVHRTTQPVHVLVSLHLRGELPTLTDVEHALGHGRRLSRKPDQIGRTDVVFPAPEAWALPTGATVAVEVDHGNSVHVMTVEVPVAGGPDPTAS
jgi:hypothetical protein